MKMEGIYGERSKGKGARHERGRVGRGSRLWKRKEKKLLINKQ